MNHTGPSICASVRIVFPRRRRRLPLILRPQGSDPRVHFGMGRAGGIKGTRRRRRRRWRSITRSQIFLFISGDDGDEDFFLKFGPFLASILFISVLFKQFTE